MTWSCAGGRPGFSSAEDTDSSEEESGDDGDGDAGGSSETGGSSEMGESASNGDDGPRECKLYHCDCSYCDFNPDYKCVENCEKTCGNTTRGLFCNGGSTCIPIEADRNNCGACGHRCEDEEYCSEGECLACDASACPGESSGGGATTPAPVTAPGGSTGGTATAVTPGSGAATSGGSGGATTGQGTTEPPPQGSGAGGATGTSGSGGSAGGATEAPPLSPTTVNTEEPSGEPVPFALPEVPPDATTWSARLTDLSTYCWEGGSPYEPSIPVDLAGFAIGSTSEDSVPFDFCIYRVILETVNGPVTLRWGADGWLPRYQNEEVQVQGATYSYHDEGGSSIAPPSFVGEVAEGDPLCVSGEAAGAIDGDFSSVYGVRVVFEFNNQSEAVNPYTPEDYGVTGISFVVGGTLPPVGNTQLFFDSDVDDSGEAANESHYCAYPSLPPPEEQSAISVTAP